MHIKLKNKRGQSTVEYVLLVTAVIAVVIAFTTGTGTNTLQGQLNSALGNAAADIGDESGQLDTSHPVTNEAAGSGYKSPTPQISVNIAG